MKKTTQELLELLKNKPSIIQYLDDNIDEFAEQSLPELLNDLLIQKKIHKADCIREASLDRTYGYQIFSGTRIPSRDKLIALAFGMHLSFEEVQMLLKYSHNTPLYPRDERDSIIIFAFTNQISMMDCNDLLFEFGYECL